MKAVYIDSHGSRESAKIGEFPAPERAPGEVLVRVRAAAVNRVDLYMRNSGAGITHTLPQVMGLDGVGEVVEAGPGSGLQSGQRVIIYPAAFCGRCEYCIAGEQPYCEAIAFAGEHRHGTFAEYVAMPAASVLPISDSLDFSTAAALPTAYLTAWRMVFTKGQVQAGQVVAVFGIGGGVAVATLQLAKLAGARVIVTSSSDDKLARAAALGADETINHVTENNVARRILELTGGRGADVVFDNVGEATWETSLRAVAKGGRVVTCGATTGGNPPADLQRVFVRQIQILGSTLGTVAEFRALLRVVEQRQIIPVIDRTFSLDEAREALDYLEKQQQFGKILLTVV